jgi:hypothetical protein
MAVGGERLEKVPFRREEEDRVNGTWAPIGGRRVTSLGKRTAAVRQEPGQAALGGPARRAVGGQGITGISAVGTAND